MVRVGIRALQEERPVRAREVADRVDRAVGDPRVRVELLRDPRAPRLAALRELDLRRRDRVLRPEELVGVLHLPAQPPAPVPVLEVGVHDREIRALEAVVGQLEVVRGIALPGRFQLLAVPPGAAAARLDRQAVLRIARPLRRRAVDVLQMRLADQRGGVAGGAQQLDEHGLVQRKLDAVVAHAVRRGHPAGHDRGPVRHADRARDVAALGAEARVRERVDVRRADDPVAVAAEVVGAVLVGDDEEKVRAFRHALHSALMFAALTTPLHFARSRSIAAVTCAGSSQSGSMPADSSRLRTSGSS